MDAPRFVFNIDFNCLALVFVTDTEYKYTKQFIIMLCALLSAMNPAQAGRLQIGVVKKFKLCASNRDGLLLAFHHKLGDLRMCHGHGWSGCYEYSGKYSRSKKYCLENAFGGFCGLLAAAFSRL